MDENKHFIDVRLKFTYNDYNRWLARPILATFYVEHGEENRVVSKLMAGFEGSCNPINSAYWNERGKYEGHVIFR